MLFSLNKKINSLSIVVTRRCNLRCSYCYSPHLESDISREALEKSAEFFLTAPGQPKRVFFVGGEPTLAPENIRLGLEIFRRAARKHKKKLEIVINTNGTVSDPRTINLLGKFDYVSLSLDGQKKSHDLHRCAAGGKPTFVKSLAFAKKIKRFFPGKLIINKVVTPDNCSDFFDDIRFIYSLAPRAILWNVALGQVGWNRQSIQIFSNQVAKTRKWAESLPLKKEKFFPRLFGRPELTCVLDGLALDSNGRFFSCEIAARAGRDCLGDVWRGLKPELVSCSFNPQKKRCRLALCRRCGQICLNPGFGKTKGGRSAFFLKRAKAVSQGAL